MPMHKIFVITTFGNTFNGTASVDTREIEFDNQVDLDAAVKAIRESEKRLQYHLHVDVIVLC
jgi:hypothetical protein